MLIVKKLIFTLPFLIFLSWFYFQLNFFFKDVYLVFGLNISVLLQLIWLTVSLALCSMCFIIFCTLSEDFRFILPVAILGSLISLGLLPTPLSLVVWIGTILSLSITYLMFKNKLATYLTFQANTLLTPSIKSLSSFLIITASLALYLSAQTEIKQNGFKIPDSLIDTALNFATPGLPDIKGESIAQVSLTQEQIELLKQNPDLLKQQGIDPNTLDQLGKTSPSAKSPYSPLSSQSTSNDAIKTLIQSQIQNLVKPYLNLLPIFLAGLFFITLHSFHSLLSIIYPILITLIFWVFEKTGFIKFEKEMREVKKLVV